MATTHMFFDFECAFFTFMDLAYTVAEHKKETAFALWCHRPRNCTMRDKAHLNVQISPKV